MPSMAWPTLARQYSSGPARGNRPRGRRPPVPGRTDRPSSATTSPLASNDFPRRARADSRIPALRFGLYDTFIHVDHAAHDGTELWAVDLLEEGERPAPRPAWIDGNEDLEESDFSPPPPVRSAVRPGFRGFTRRGRYLAAARRTLEYIAAGDIFQANVSQRFAATGPGGSRSLLYTTASRSRQPRPVLAPFLAWDDLAVVEREPGAFLPDPRAMSIITRPIKGTRPRSADPAEDARLGAELLASPKDRAELTMIVDLERNDLGQDLPVRLGPGRRARRDREASRTSTT